MPISSNTTGFRPGICTSTSRPTSPYTGQVIQETDTGNTLRWNGSSWVGISSSTLTASGAVSGSSVVATGAISGASLTASNTSDYPLSVSSSSYQIANFTSSGGETNLHLNNTSSTGRNYSIISGGAGGAFAGGSFGIYDNNAAAIRLSMNNNGAVTLPYQPYVQLRGNGGWVDPRAVPVRNGAPSGFSWTSVYNVGGHWSDTTGNFIVPVSGVYQCSFQTYYLTGGTAGYYTHFLWYVGGTASWNGGTVPYNIYGYGGDYYADGVSANHLIYVTAGNSIAMYMSSGGSPLFYGDYTYMSIRLVG